MIVPIPTLPRLWRIARQVMVETMTIVQSKPIFTLENSICVTEETACIQPSPASGIRSAGRYKRFHLRQYGADQYHSNADRQIVWCWKIGYHIVTECRKISEYNADYNLQKLNGFEFFRKSRIWISTSTTWKGWLLFPSRFPRHRSSYTEWS